MMLALFCHINSLLATVERIMHKTLKLAFSGNVKFMGLILLDISRPIMNEM